MYEGNSSKIEDLCKHTMVKWEENNPNESM
jgi:hypothetical protein